MNTSRTTSNSIITNSAISSFNESKIIWAVIASILLHVLFALGLPNFKFDDIKKEHQVLKIEIQNPEQPPVILPQPPVIESKPIPKIVKPKKPKPKIKPIIDPVAKPIEPPAPEEPTPPVIAVKPTPLPKPEAIVVPQPPPVTIPPEPVQPSPKEIDDALSQYGSLLGRNIAKHKSYPKIARKRGWQGKVILDLKIDGDGNILSAKVRDSSGHAILDKEALKMAKKAAPFPKPPLALQSQSFNITVPVSFKLSSS